MFDGIRETITEAVRMLTEAIPALGAIPPGADVGEQVYLRTVTSVGGDALLGIKGAETVVDTLVEPSPLVTNVNDREIAFSNGRLLFGDMKIMFVPPTARTDVEAATALRIRSGLWRLVQIDGVTLAGVEIGVKAVVRRIVEASA